MIPKVTITPSFLLLLDVNDATHVTCMGMGGPRLMLTLDKDGAVVADRAVGNDALQYNFIANNYTFGTYTCTAAIDDMEVSQSVDVVGTYICVASCLYVSAVLCVCLCACVNVCMHMCVCVCGAACSGQ